MAYDPEAREKSNAAMVMGIVALVLVVGGALAYLATRPRAGVTVVNPTTTRIIDRPVAVPAPPGVPAPPSTIVVEKPVVVGGTTTRIERNTTTTRQVPAPGTSPAARPGDTNVNVTIQNPTPAAASAPSTTTTNPSSTSGVAAENAAADTAANSATNTATPTPGY